jgi:hypothetical protein
VTSCSLILVSGTENYAIDIPREFLTIFFTRAELPNGQYFLFEKHVDREIPASDGCRRKQVLSFLGLTLPSSSNVHNG